MAVGLGVSENMIWPSDMLFLSSVKKKVGAYNLSGPLYDK